jgi:hypothetical protein
LRTAGLRKLVVRVVALGGLVVAWLPLDPKFACSHPAEDDGIFNGDKNP